jgi:hypothetical protein
VDLAEVRAAQGKGSRLVAIDRPRKGAFAERHPRATRMVAAQFVPRVRQALPDNAHTVLPDHGVPFTVPPHQWFAGRHRFGRVCREVGVAHRLTKPAPPEPTARASA